jgi:hypothetical protein
MPGGHVGGPVTPQRVESRDQQGRRLVIDRLVQLDVTHQGDRGVSRNDAVHPGGVVRGVDPDHAASVDERAMLLVQPDPGGELGEVIVVGLGEIPFDPEMTEQGGGAAQRQRHVASGGC